MPTQKAAPKYPPRPKLAAEPTPQDLYDYTRAVFERGQLLSRDGRPESTFKPVPWQPNREYALAPVRHLTSLKWSPENRLKRCKHCKRVAVKNTSICWFHGGAAIVAARKFAKGIPPLKYGVRSAANQLLKDHRGSVPDELRRHPVFAAAIADLGNGSNGQMVARDMIVGWHAMAAGDGVEIWTSALNKARAAGYF